MAFNTALSGLRAANTDLSVIGHNIANASTTAFKASRAEFADVYATSILGTGNLAVGSGALVADVTQQFGQGNISFTNNTLDLAISGNGFFIFSEGGATTYGRAGNLQLDNEGFVVSNQGKRLQGFQASDTGAVSGVLSDLQIDVQTQPPRLTTGVDARLNLDARETPIAFGNRSADGGSTGIAQLGGGNGYPSETITVTAIDGTQQSATTAANGSAAAAATALNSLIGIQASASTTATLGNINSTTAGFGLTLNGVNIGTGAGVDAQSIANSINALSDTTLPGITATVAGGQVTVTSDSGVDLQFALAGGAGDSLELQGIDTPPTVVTLNAGDTGTVGGSVTLAADEDYVVASDLAGTGLFATTGNAVAGGNELALDQAFDPSDPNTYNHATSLTIYDSLGVPHVLTQYFVKESDLDETVTNNWRMYVQIDGENVGDPNPNGSTPSEPTLANFRLVFNEDGSLDQNASDSLLISNWTPLDANGNPNGSLGPLNVAGGGSTTLADPPTSSNFVIDLGGTTQFGSAFSVNTIDQDGFAVGRLAGIDIGTEGVIFARFTNGEAQTLGQVALADFTNQQGLAPNGDTEWTETFESGGPIIGAPGTAALGSIQSGALEESTTELSEELVKLIIAQRNFQANAQTIQTADAVTQTIINIR